MASFLLDENISYIVAEQVRSKVSAAHVVSIHEWCDGAFLSVDDETVLEAARLDGLTLITYDLGTIPAILKRLGEDGRSHAGVVFIDDRSIAGNDYGGLVRAISGAVRQMENRELTDVVLYLAPAR